MAYVPAGIISLHVIRDGIFYYGVYHSSFVAPFSCVMVLRCTYCTRYNSFFFHRDVFLLPVLRPDGK